MDRRRTQSVYDGYTVTYIGIVAHGKDWKKVEEVVGTRTGTQVRSHAQKFFNKFSNKDEHHHKKVDSVKK